MNKSFILLVCFNCFCPNIYFNFTKRSTKANKSIFYSNSSDKSSKKAISSSGFGWSSGFKSYQKMLNDKGLFEGFDI